MIAQDELTDYGYVLVRLGMHGQVGRLSSELEDPRRGSRVVCRTVRGVEAGQVLGPARYVGTRQGQGAVEAGAGDGRVLRLMRPEDELLWSQLQHLAREAHTSCQEWLKDAFPEVILLDVEPLLDGRTVYFHFLNDVPAAVQDYMDHLASVYEQQVRDSQFANLLENGCGPKCGTPEAENGCSASGGCAVCRVASNCRR